MAELTGQTLEHYHVLEQIARGGMAVVYRGYDLENQRHVAIKVLANYLLQEEKFRTRFKREIELLQKLDHPHIVSILDYGEYQGSPYIVMPFLRGGTLQDRLTEGTLSAVEGARLSEQISAALAHAHAHDVIHRDVKTSNILLDDEGNALLSDFGFALWKEASIRLTGSALIGTPAYMSPEQCLGEPVNARSDQYSFAVVLYRIATGRLPFEGDTPLALAMKHIQQPLPPPRSINPKLPEGVEAVLLKALAKEPEHRFKDMSEFNAAFQAALTGVLDPAMVRTPQPMHFNIPTEVRLQHENDSSFFGYLGRSRAFRKPVLVGLISVLLMLPIGAFAMRELGYSIFFQPASIAPDYQATIDALYSANAPQPGSEFSPEQIEAAVMGTLSALVEADGVDVDTVVVEEGGTFNIMGGGGSPTPSPTLSPVPIPSIVRTPTSRDGDEQSTQDASSTPIPPSETSSASPTATPSAETTSAPTVTQTLESTDTPVPPTSTPLGICKTKPHPVFPTCTPVP